MEPTDETAGLSNSKVLVQAQQKLVQAKLKETNLNQELRNLIDKENARKRGINASDDNNLGGAIDIERYLRARTLYLQRRMRNLLCESVSTFDGKSFQHSMESEDGDYNKIHSDELTKLNALVQQLSSDYRNFKENAPSDVRKIRSDLEQLVKSLEEKQSRSQAQEITPMDPSIINSDESYKGPDDRSPPTKDEQNQGDARVVALERRKLALQQELAALQEQCRSAERLCDESNGELARLRKSQAEDNTGDPKEQVQQQIDQLREVKDYYDSMRHVIEELGGLKIINTTERGSDHHLILMTELCGKYLVEVELQPIPRRINEFKVLDAHWKTSRIVSSQGICGTNIKPPIEEDPGDIGKQADQPLDLVLPPLEDLVQVARVTLPPGDDVRFLLREAMGRIRILNDRVAELDALRRRVLTKIVGESGEQLICSFNEGIIACFRLYEQYVVVEKVMGVGGWDQGVIEELESDLKALALKDHNLRRHQTEWTNAVTPTVLVNKIQEQLATWKAKGTVTFPKTPRMPSKQHLELF